MTVIAVHGGAGSATRAQLGPADARARLDAVETALRSGQDVLGAGGSALDAVCAAVVALEDAPELNAGRGAVRTEAGTVELDAAVMVGSRDAGAVAAISNVRNPVLAARRVLDERRHVLLVGPAADDFAASCGVEPAPPGWFDVTAAGPPSPGTVGAVALDRYGELAAATSTGGVHGQRQGRVGDTPLIGAGTFADARSCAVSATGDGEAFIRAVFGHGVHARIIDGGLSLAAAAAAGLFDVARFGGTGGCVAVSASGDVTMPTTTKAMPRGVMRGGAEPEVWLDADE